MASTSIRISRSTHQKIKEIADRERKPIGDVVSDAIERYDDDLFWEESRAAYQRLRDDAVAWTAYQEELEAWNVTLTDGLENEDPYYSDEELEGILSEDTQER